MEIYIGDTEYRYYEQENGEVLLIPYEKKIYIEEDLDEYDFFGSEILYFRLNYDEINMPIYKYKYVLRELYKKIGDKNKILKNTIIDIKNFKKTDEKHHYIKNLGISIPSIDKNKCIHEIYKQCKKNDIGLTMQIKLNHKIIDIYYLENY